ncbi:madB domain protein [Neorickettsia helminthoeca str. Oregon]|uniref:MadB domain protein n=1 Tax=Neorickettsia helminthoeca str. Oregon TaxID=1286528 RepID=X5H2Y8_9RICK|nr:madB domain protein [Neorickettsia helminthoeca str. Oregon]
MNLTALVKDMIIYERLSTNVCVLRTSVFLLLHLSTIYPIIPMACTTSEFLVAISISFKLRTFASLLCRARLLVAKSFNSAILMSTTIPITATKPSTVFIRNIAIRYKSDHGASKKAKTPCPVRKPRIICKSRMASPLETPGFTDMSAIVFLRRCGVSVLSSQSPTLTVIIERDESSTDEQRSAHNVITVSIIKVDVLPLDRTLSRTCEVYRGKNSANMLLPELNQNRVQKTDLHFSNVLCRTVFLSVSSRAASTVLIILDSIFYCAL